MWVDVISCFHIYLQQFEWRIPWDENSRESLQQLNSFVVSRFIERTWKVPNVGEDPGVAEEKPAIYCTVCDVECNAE